MPAGTSYLVKEGMFGKKISRRKAGEENYYAFEMKNNFLHAVHPLGWFRDIAIEVDGEAVPGTDAFLVLRRQWFRVSDIRTVSEVFWNLCEPLEVYVRGTGRPEKKTSHVKVTFRMSLLEDTQILDLDGTFGERVEFAETDLEWEER